MQVESFTAGYLRVWVEYHLLLGFSHLFVYDRWGIDADLQAVLAPYIAAGEVTRVPFPFFSPVQVREKMAIAGISMSVRCAEADV